MSKRYMGSIQGMGVDGLNTPVTTVEYLVVAGVVEVVVITEAAVPAVY